MDAFSIGLLVAGLVVGFLLAYLICGSRSRRQADEFESRIHALQRQATDRDRQLTAAQSQADEHQKRLAALGDEQRSEQEKLKQTLVSLDDANRTIAELEQNLNGAVADRLAVDADLEQARAESAALHRQIEQLNEQVAALESALAADAEAYRSLQEESESRGGEVQELAAQVAGLQEKYSDERLNLLIRPYLNSARARELAEQPPGMLGRPISTEADTANPDQLREALLAMAAAKINADSRLREREIALVDSGARISSLRTNVDALAAAGAELANRLGSVPPQEQAQRADLLEAGLVAGAAQSELAALSAELADTERALDRLMATLAAKEDELSDLRALAAAGSRAAQAPAAQAAALDLDALRERLAAAVAALQALPAEGAPETEESVAQQGPDWEEPGGAEELAEEGLLDGFDALAEGEGAVEDELTAELPELGELDAAIARTHAALQHKVAAAAALESDLNDLQSVLADTQAARTQLEEQVEQRRAALAALQERVAAVVAELDAAPLADEDRGPLGVAPAEGSLEGALEGAAAEELAPELPEGTWQEPPAEPDHILEEAAAIASVAPDAEAVDAAVTPEPVTAEQPESEGSDLLDRLAAGVAGLLVALRKRDDSVTALRGDVDELEAARADLDSRLQAGAGEIENLTAAKDDLDARLAAQEGEFGAVEERVAGWLESLRERFAGDPELLALLDARPTEEMAPAAIPEEPAIADGGAVEGEPFEGEPFEGEPFEGEAFEGEAFKGDEAGELAAPEETLARSRAAALAASLSAGSAALTAALEKKEAQLGAAQGELETVRAASDALQGQIAESHDRLDGLRAEIAAWYSRLHEDYTADPDVVEALRLTPPEPAAEEGAEETLADLSEEEAAVAPEETAEPDAVAMLRAGIAAVGVALAKRAAELNETRSSAVDLAAREESLRGLLSERETSLGGLAERIAAWVDGLRAEYADDPEVMAAFDAAPVAVESEPDETVAPEGGVQEAAEGAQEAAETAVSDPVALLQSGIAAVGVALGKRSAELDEIRSSTVDLAAREQSLHGLLAERETSLGGLAERISAWVDGLRAEYGDDPDVLAALEAGRAGVESEPGEAATPEGEAQPAGEGAQPVAGEVAADPVTMLQSGIAAVGVALAKRAAEADELRTSTVDLAAREDSLRGLLSERETSLGGLAERIAAWVDGLRAAYGDDPDVVAALDAVQAAPVPTEAEQAGEDAQEAVQAAPAPQALLAAGIGALGVVIGKKEDTLAQLQARFDGALTAQAEAEQALQQEHAEAEALNAGVAAWYTEMQTRFAGDEELAALFQAGQEGDGAAPAPASLLESGRAAVAAAFDKQETLIAYLQSDLSGVQQLKAQAEEQLADLNEQVANLQAQIEAAAAEKAELEQELARTQAELDGMLDEVAAAGDSLRAAFNLPAQDEVAPGEEAAAEADAAEQDAAEARRRKLARVGVLTAGVTSAAAAFQQRSADLDSAQAKVADLETQAAEAATRMEAIQLEAAATVPLAEHEEALAALRTELDTAVAERDRVQAELDDLQAKIADARSQIEAAIGDDEELHTLFTQALQQPESAEATEAEGAERSGLRAAAGIGLLSAGMAGVAGAARKRSEEAQQAQGRLEELAAQSASVDAVRAELESNLAAQEQLLSEAQAQMVQLQGELGTAVTERDRLQVELSDVQAKIAEARARIEEAIGDDEDLRASFASALQGGEAGGTEIGLLAAGMAGVVGAAHMRTESVQQAQARLAELELHEATLGDARTQAESSLAEKEQALAAAQAQVGELQAQLEAAAQEREQALAGATARAGEVQAQLDAAVAERDRLQADLDNLQATIADARARIEEAIGEDEELRAAFASALQGEEAADEAGVAGRVASIGVLTAGMAGLVGTARRRSEDVQQVQSRYVELESQGAALGEEQSRLAAELQAREHTLAEVQAQLAAAQEERDATAAQFNGLNERLTALQSELESATAARAALEAQAQEREAGAQAQLAAVQEEREAAAVEVSGLNDRLGALQGELDSVTAARAALEVQLQERESDLQAQLASLGDERSRLEAALAEREEALAGSQGRVAELQSAVEQAQGQLVQTNEQLTGVRAELESTQAARTQAEEALRRNEAEMDQLVNRLSGLGDELRSAYGDEADFGAAESDARRSGAGRLARIGVLSVGVGAALNRTRKQANALQSTQSQVDALTAQLAAARSAEQEAAAQLQQRDQAVRSAQDEVARLQASLNERNSRIGALEGDLDTLNRQVRDLRQQIEEAEDADRRRTRGVALAGGAVVAGAAMRGRGEGEEGEEGGEEAAATGEEAGEQAAGAGASAEVAALQEQLAAAQAQLDEVNRQLASTSEERAALEAAISEREAEATQFRTRLTDLVGSVVEEPSQADWPRLSGIKAGAARGAFLAGTRPVFSNQLQDLTLVAGIGNVLEQRLFEAGIGSYWELATMTDEDFARVLHTANLPVQRFTPSEIRAAASRLAEATNSVGHIWEDRPIDDFDPLPGIGRVYEKRLYAAGIFTFADLAATTAERLAEICKAPKTRMPDYAAWIEVARARQSEGAAAEAAEEPGQAQAGTGEPAETDEDAEG